MTANNTMNNQTQGRTRTETDRRRVGSPGVGTNVPAENPGEERRTPYVGGRLASVGNTRRGESSHPERVRGSETRERSEGRGARLKIASLNMKGYGREETSGGTDKWFAINQIMKEGRMSILAVQEAHLTEDRIRVLNNVFASQLCVVGSPHDGNQTGACGVAFAITRKHLKNTNIETEVLIPGRAMQITLRWTAARTITLLNVYAPNTPTDNAAFWTKLQEWYERPGTKAPDVMMGDFNMVEDAIDRLPARTDPQSVVDALKSLCMNLNLIDTWRRAHPTDRSFTFLQAGGSSQSRLDRIYVKGELAQMIAGWDARVPGVATDHSIVSCSVANYGDPTTGKGRWALPLNLLDDKIFIDAMKKQAAISTLR